MKKLLAKYNTQEKLDAALISASKEGKACFVRSLLAAGANVNAVDEDGSSALLCAVMHGHTDVVHALLATEEDVHIVNHYENSILLFARQQGFLEIFRLVEEWSARHALRQQKNRCTCAVQ